MGDILILVMKGWMKKVDGWSWFVGLIWYLEGKDSVINFLEVNCIMIVIGF